MACGKNTLFFFKIVKIILKDIANCDFSFIDWAFRVVNAKAPTLKRRACAQKLPGTGQARIGHGSSTDRGPGRADLGFPYCDSPCVRSHCFENPLSMACGKNIANFDF